MTNKVSVPVWLSARHLLRVLDDDVIVSCFDDIISTYKAKKRIITNLVTAGNEQEITQIVNILKTAQLKEIERNNGCILVNNNENKSYFDYLSKDSVFNICEFLDEREMTRFKKTCSLIALIVFEIMKSYKMRVLNMNELIQQNDYKYPIDLKTNDLLKINYIKQHNKYKSLMNIYGKRYDIPVIDHILLLSTRSHYDENNPLFQAKIIKNMIKFNTTKINKINNVFFIFDQSKILTLNNTKNLKKMSEIYKPLEMKNYGIVLLQYFDLKQQQIQNIQYLWLDSNIQSVRFEEYILNNLYSSYCELYPDISSIGWLNQLLYTMNKMKQFGSHPHCVLLNFYQYDESYIDHDEELSILPRRSIPKNNRKTKINYTKYRRNMRNFNEFGTILFELNYDHPYFKAIEHNKINDTNPLRPFCQNLMEYINDQNTRFEMSIPYVDGNDLLQTQIKSFDATFNMPSINNIDFNVKVSSTLLTTFGMLRRQIAAKFKHILKANNVEIYECKHGFRYNSLNICEWNRNIKEKGDTQYQWEIVRYDTNRNNMNDIYRISIYESDKLDYGRNADILSFPIAPIKQLQIYYDKYDEIKDDEKYTKIEQTTWHSINAKQMKAKLKFNTGDFMQCIVDTMSDTMYGDEYKPFIDRYNNKEYSFVIMKNEDINKKYFKCYDINDEYIQYQSDEIPNINVLIMRNYNYNDDNDEKQKELIFPVIVRFCKEEGFSSFFGNDICASIGFPKKIWITKQTTIQMMMDIYGKNLHPKYSNIVLCAINNSCIDKEKCIYKQILKYYQHENKDKNDILSSTHELLIALSQKQNEKDGMCHDLTF